MDNEKLKEFTKEHQAALENITSFMVHNRIIEFEINDGGKDADVTLTMTFVGDD